MTEAVTVMDKGAKRRMNQAPVVPVKCASVGRLEPIEWGKGR